MNSWTQAIVIKGIEYALKTLRQFLAEKDFKEVADDVLNRIESYFAEGTVQDVVAEMVTKQVRELLGIADSNPDN